MTLQLTLLALLGTAEAFLLWSPLATTTVDLPLTGITPVETPPPGVPVLRRGKVRRAVTSATVWLMPDNTCGYYDGDPNHFLTCNDVSAQCAVTTTLGNGYVGCCSAGDCNSYHTTACLDLDGYNNGGCNDDCSDNPELILCTDTGSPYCHTVSMDLGAGFVMWMYSCNPTAATAIENLNALYSGESDGRAMQLTTVLVTVADETASVTTATETQQQTQTQTQTKTAATTATAPTATETETQTATATPTDTLTDTATGTRATKTTTASSSSSSTATSAGAAATAPAGSSGASGETEKKSTSHTGAIVGGVVGGLGGLACLAGLLFYLWRRHQRAAEAAAAAAAVGAGADAVGGAAAGGAAGATGGGPASPPPPPMAELQQATPAPAPYYSDQLPNPTHYAYYPVPTGAVGAANATTPDRTSSTSPLKPASNTARMSTVSAVSSASLPPSYGGSPPTIYEADGTPYGADGGYHRGQIHEVE